MVVRHNGLLSNIGKTSLVFNLGTVTMRWDCSAGGEFRRHATDYVLPVFIALTRLLAASPTQDLLLAVTLAHTRPGLAEAVREYETLFRCPVHFNHDYSSLVLPVSALTLSLRHGDAFLKALLEQHTQDLLSQQRQITSIIDDSKRLITAMLADGEPSRDKVAEQLGISSRSLHRQLQDAGSSYRALLDEIRPDLWRKNYCNRILIPSTGFPGAWDFIPIRPSCAGSGRTRA